MNGLDIIKARAFGAGGGGSGGSGGGSELLDSLIDRSITEIKSEVLRVGTYAFRDCERLTTANFPVATRIGICAFYNCTALKEIKFPCVELIDLSGFRECSELETADFPCLSEIAAVAFADCAKLKTFILRSPMMCVLQNNNAFNNTTISSGKGYIYVPSALVDTYKAATNWSTHASKFRALEDYTVDGTITGELDAEKIGA